MKALSSEEISKILSTCPVTKKLFKGILARGLTSVALKNFETPVGFIINTDYYYNKGTHWIGIIYFSHKNIYFDLLGLPSSAYDFEDLTEKNESILVQNTRTLQSLDSNACGYFAIYFFYFIALGFDLEDILEDFENLSTFSIENSVYLFVKNLAWDLIRLEI